MEVFEFCLGDLADVMLVGSEMHQESPAYRDLPFDVVQVGAWAAMHIRRSDMAAWGVWTPAGQLAGGMFASLTETFFGPSQLAMDDGLYVRPEFRGTPAASLLIDRFLSWAKEKGAVRANVAVSAGIDNERAIQFLVKKHKFDVFSYHLGVEFDHSYENEAAA